MAYADPTRLFKPYLTLVALLMFGLVHFVVDKVWSRFCLRVHGIETGKGGYPLPLPKFKLMPEDASPEELLCAAVREICVGWVRIAITALACAIIFVEVVCIDDRLVQMLIILLSTGMLFVANLVFSRLEPKDRQVIWCILLFKNDLIAKKLKENRVSKKRYAEAGIIRAACYAQIYATIATFVYTFWRFTDFEDGQCRDPSARASENFWVSSLLDGLFYYQFCGVALYLLFMQLYVMAVLKYRGDGTPPEIAVYYSRLKMMYYPSELKCVYKLAGAQAKNESAQSIGGERQTSIGKTSFRNRGKNFLYDLNPLRSRAPSTKKEDVEAEQEQGLAMI